MHVIRLYSLFRLGLACSAAQRLRVERTASINPLALLFRNVQRPTPLKHASAIIQIFDDPNLNPLLLKPYANSPLRTMFRNAKQIQVTPKLLERAPAAA
jgi:hypothetical protein